MKYEQKSSKQEKKCLDLTTHVVIVHENTMIL